MLFVGTSIIHPSTEGVFLLCNILDLLIYSYELLKSLLENSQSLNGQRELRLQVSILLRQMRYLIESLEKIREYCSDPMEFKDYEKELIVGVKSLDAFAGYIRNINLQTLQAPNYNLQINGSIEKILMAYDWFISHVLDIARNNITGKTSYYHVSRDLCPVLIPCIEERDQSVRVLIELSRRQKTQKELSKNLMVVFVPNVESMEQYESYIPILCHEIAHNIRFREQEVRNKLLASYVLNIFSYSLFWKIFYGGMDLFQKNSMLKLIQNEVCSALFGMGSEQYKGELKCFEEVFKQKMLSFCKGGNLNPETYLGIGEFIRNTQDCVLEYDSEYFECVNRIKQLEENIQKSLEKGYKRMKKGELSEKSLIDEIEKNLVELQKNCIQYACAIVNSHCQRMGENIVVLDFKDEVTLSEKIRKILEKKRKGGRADLGYCKVIHNCWWEYRDLKLKLEAWSGTKLLEEYFYYCEKVAMGRKIFKKAKQMLSLHEDNEIEWNWSNKSRMEIEKVKNQLGIAQNDEKKFATAFNGALSDYEEETILNLIEMTFSVYREAASDLFMCGVFEFSIFGYLQFASTHFPFETKGETRFEAKRCGIVCRAIWKRKNKKNTTGKIEKIAQETFKELSEKVSEEHVEIETESPELWSLFQEESFSMSKLEKVIRLLYEKLYLIKAENRNEKISVLYTKMYRFCKVLRLICEQKDYTIEKILTDFISQGSFFEEKEAEEIRRQIFEDDTIRKQITTRWNESFAIDKKGTEEYQKEQMMYAEFLMNCYRRCQNDVKNWEGSE